MVHAHIDTVLQVINALPLQFFYTTENNINYMMETNELTFILSFIVLEDLLDPIEGIVNHSLLYEEK